MEQPAQPTTTPHSRRSMKPVLLVILAILLIGAAAYAGYLYRDRQAVKDTKSLQSQVNDLKASQASLKSQLSGTAGDSESKQPSQAVLDNIMAAVNSRNYAALEGYSASPIKVIIAATEGVGSRTAAQMVSDIAYLDSGTEPWDFNLPAATLADYRSGDYSQYFPSTALIGKSANGYVVAFQFDANGKINGVFMAADGSSL